MRAQTSDVVTHPAAKGTGQKALTLVSVVLPVFNECDNLQPLLSELTDALALVDHEVVMVDDGSTDDSLAEMRRLADRYSNLRVLSRPQRGGQSAALLHGIDGAAGEIVVTLDADGQNDPKDIPRLLELFQERAGCVVVGYRARRAASLWKRFQARVANSMRDLITGDRIMDTGCALRVVWRDDLLKMPRFNGMHRFLPTLLKRAGLEVVQVPVNDRPRLHGRSKYGMRNRVFVGLIDAFGVRWLRNRSLPREGN